MTKEMKTGRLDLTRLTADMAEALHRNSLDEDVRRFVPDEVWETADEARETIEHLIRAYDTADGPFVWAVLTKQGENIGYVQACRLQEDFEIGYHIAQSHTGRGYAAEAVSAFLPFISQRLGVSRLWGIVLEENAASWHVLEACGFVLQEQTQAPYGGRLRQVRRYLWRCEESGAGSAVR